MGLRSGGGGEGCGDGPRLAPFRLGRARGGGRRLGGSGVRRVGMRFSAEPEGERMRTSGLLGAGGGGAAGAGAGAAGCAKLEAGEEAVLSRIQAVQTSWTCFHLSTFAILRASCHRRISACSRLSACFAARAALRRVRALVAARLLPCSERDARLDLREPSCFAAGKRHARWVAG